MTCCDRSGRPAAPAIEGCNAAVPMRVYAQRYNTVEKRSPPVRPVQATAA